MGQVVAIISGKGGTGKTTVCAGIASCLAAEGQSVLCIDADAGLRNLDIALGMDELSVLPFTEILRGNYTLDDATRHPSIVGLSLLTAPTREDLADATDEAFRQLLDDAREKYDWCLIDAPAGIGMGFELATRFADQVILIATADPSSLRDAKAASELLEREKVHNVCLVVNRVKAKMFSKMGMTIDDMMDDIGLPLLGIVPEDPRVTLAAGNHSALVLYSGKGASVACLHIARRMRGIKTKLMKI